ncbi:MAG: hypothetical protein Q8N12_07305, partial [Thermodesulfovibrionales bacterium]|nr:hypothetical protein [Thermodesulfovibrionales bacterium]
IPPLGGFLSKWYIAIGSIEAQQLPILLVLASSTILNACYFLPIVYAAFFKEPAAEGHHEQSAVSNQHPYIHSTFNIQHSTLKEAPALMVIPLVLTAIGALVLFFAPSVFLELARMVVAGVIN